MRKIAWVLLLVTVFFFTSSYLWYLPIQQAGDIVEYYGMTESIMRHGSVELTDSDQETLEKKLHPEYFNNPGYYIEGRGEGRFPVHFFFYSLLLVSMRWVLEFFQIDPLRSLAVGNVFLWGMGVSLVWRWFIRDTFQRIFFLLIWLVSPVMSFLSWPGPDVLFLSLLLVGVMAFLHKKYILAVIFTVLASWNSQPILVVGLGMVFWVLVQQTTVVFEKNSQKVLLRWSKKNYHLMRGLLLALGLAVVPYFYNRWAFGVYSPWTLLQDNWTQQFGFGIHNISLWKLYEQVFDLNTGLFWWAPLLVILGCVWIYKSSRNDRKVGFLGILMVLAAFLYQTNPGWHYGTAGFGPNRHSIFLLPFLAAILVSKFDLSRKNSWWFGILFFWQLLMLGVNGGMSPNFTKALFHSPQAELILTHAPWAYSPSAEIFIDRTTHEDKPFLRTAVFEVQGECRKAYVLPDDWQMVEERCGKFPPNVRDNLDYDYMYELKGGRYFNF